MLIQSLRPQSFSQVVGNELNNKILMSLAKDTSKGPSTIILQGSFGSGKAIDVDSIVPTPTGQRRAGDIQVGDYLFDRFGNPTQVTGVYPQGLLDSYIVTFEDGRRVCCNSEHLWTILDHGSDSFKTVTLQTIIDNNLKAEIPVNHPVQYSAKVYTIPPYLFGILLTNSTINKTTVLYGGKYKDIFESQMSNIFWEYNLKKSYSIPKDKDGNIISKESFYGDLLEEVNNHKIPEVYLTGSIPQRWELLQGIMDTIGTVSNDNNVFCEVSHKNTKDSILRLVNSLGLVVSVIEGNNKYILYFKTNKKILSILFLNKKIDNTVYNSNIDTTKIAIISIEKEDVQRDMVCFYVDNSEHLFLCNDFIVTHNTTSSRLFAKALNCKNLKTNDICGACEICKSDLNNVPWYTEFDSSAMGNVESIRDLRDIFITTARGYNKVITIDECLNYDQRVLCRINGERKLIDIGYLVNNKLPVEVMSYSIQDNKYEWKKVLAWHKNSKKPVTRREFVRQDGLRKYYLTSTDNHRVFRPDGSEVFVGDIKEGEDIIVCKASLQQSVLNRETNRISYYVIPEEVEQIILGTLLGDASMSLSSGGIPRLIIKQGIMQSRYFYDKRDILGDLFSNEYISDNHAGYGKPVLVAYSKNRKELLPIYNKVYKNGKKTITEDLLDSLTPLSIAIWYMDDGSLCSKPKNSNTYGTIHLSTYAFTKEENIKIQKYFKDKYDIDFTLTKDNKNRGFGYFIRSSHKEDAQKFLRLVSPYVPEYFSYKLEKNIVSGSLSGIPCITYIKKDTEALFSTAKYTGKKQEKMCHGGYTYDLTVEDNHNYIANGVLVHNCHLLSKTAQSALLKVFEETPKGVYFLLATTDPDKLLPTIRSRSLELVFTPKTKKEVREDIEKHAADLGMSLSQATIDVIATRSRGIMRNAHMLLDKVNILSEEEFLKSDTPSIALLNKYVTSLLKKDRDLVLESVSDMSRIPVAYLKDDWQDYFLNLMRASINPSLVKDEKIKKLASILGKNTVNLVKMCTQDWIINSFQSSIQAETAMLALYQSME